MNRRDLSDAVTGSVVERRGCFGFADNFHSTVFSFHESYLGMF